MGTTWMGRFGVRAVMALGLALSFPGCGGDEPEAPTPSSDAAPAEKAAAPTPAPAAKTPDLSSTATLFSYAPADPAVVMVLPAVNSLESQLAAFWKRIAESPAEVDEALAAWSAELASTLGVAPGKTPTEVLAGLGIDPSSAMAVYIDMEAFNERLEAEIERLKAQLESEESGAMADPSADEGASEMDDSGEEMAAESMPSFVDPVEAAGLPAMVGAFTVTDAAKAVQQLDAALQRSPKAASFSKREQESNGVTITVYDPSYCSYFVHENVLFVGNDLAWLEAVASRAQSPGQVKATTFDGTVEDEQLIAELRLDRLEPFFRAMNIANAMIPGQAGMVAAAQANSWDEMKAMYAGTDPVVMTLEWDEARVSLDSRLNMDAHPAVKEMTGSSGPMRLATVLPASTQAMFGIRFTPEMKSAMRKYWIDAIPPEALQDPNMAGVVMGANQAIELIDDELVVGMTGMAGGMPTGIAMIGLTNPEAVIQQFGMFLMMAGSSLPEMPSEPGEIKELTFGGALTVYYTVVNNALMVASVRGDLEAAVEHVKASTASGYFASLDPAMDPARPRYFAFSLKPEAINAMTAMQGGADPSMAKLLAALKEMRVVMELDGSWLVQELDIYLTAP